MFGKPGINVENAMPQRWHHAERVRHCDDTAYPRFRYDRWWTPTGVIVPDATAETWTPEGAVITGTVTFNGKERDAIAANRAINPVPMRVREYDDVLILDDGPQGQYRLVKIKQDQRLSA